MNRADPFGTTSYPRRLRAVDVEQILKHEFYAGWFVWRDERYRGKHEPVFTQEEWTRLQATFGRAPYGAPLAASGALQGFLSCAECGCRITYDPKTKPDGRRYDYYRCADGHRAHDKRVHVTETKILAQLEGAIADVEVPAATADEILAFLRESHERSRVDRRRETAQLQRALDDVQAREDRLVALYVDGKLDEATYRRQRDLMQDERQGAMERMKAAHDALDAGYLATAERIFELAKQARTLWNERNPRERRELLEMVLSNPRLDGVTVRYDLKKPFAILSEMAKGGDYRAQADSNL